MASDRKNIGSCDKCCRYAENQILCVAVMVVILTAVTYVVTDHLGDQIITLRESVNILRARIDKESR